MSGLLIVLFAAALGAAEPASPPVPAPAKAKTADTDLICTYQTEKGSHFKKRVCMTKAERDARAALERNELQNKQRAFCGGGQSC